MTPDWSALYLSIRRCEAVYGAPASLTDAFAALGSTDIRFLSTDTAQGVLHRAPTGRLTLTNSGTHFSEGPLRERIGDLLEDADFAPRMLDANVAFATGAYERARQTFAWAIPIVGSETLDIEGHSLGGWETCAAPIFLPDAQIGALTAWEPPKPANPAYWAAYAKTFARLTTVYHGRSPWFHWPPKPADYGLCHNSGPSILWLHDGGWEYADQTAIADGNIFDEDDHGPSSVIAAVAALCSKPQGALT